MSEKLRPISNVYDVLLQGVLTHGDRDAHSLCASVGVFLTLSLLLVTAGYMAQENESLYKAMDSLMQNAGYPKQGDIPVLNRKIFKGLRVHIREHPYVASVRRRTSHYLTAALLTRNILVTVAHPLDNVPVMELNAILGENYSDRGSLMLTVVLVTVHEAFDPFTLKNDIAMLRLYEDISYKGNMKSISLIRPLTPLAGKRAFVTGWGRCDNMGTELCLDRSSKYYPDEKMDPMLRSVTFIINSPNDYCEGYKRHEVILYPGMLCTGGAREDDPVCPCLGVPGALLVTNARLAGILSWGFGCGYSYDLPLVYTNIQEYSSWIANNIKISRLIKSVNLSSIFEATKAVVLSDWLDESRIVSKKLSLRTDKTLEPLQIDNQIARLRGITYDVRDYMSDGAFHIEKLDMYESIRNEIRKEQLSKKFIPKRPRIPFLREETLNEIGFRKSDIFSTTSTTNSSTVIEDVVMNNDDDDDEI